MKMKRISDGAIKEISDFNLNQFIVCGRIGKDWDYYIEEVQDTIEDIVALTDVQIDATDILIEELITEGTDILTLAGKEELVDEFIEEAKQVTKNKKVLSNK